MPISQKPTSNGFNKLQRLCSRKLIDQLFASGNRTLSAFPLRVVFMVVPPDVSDRHQVMMSVSKRLFKHAVDRNRAKRQMREAWRLNNDIVLPSVPEGRSLVCAFIWTAHEPQPSQLVHTKMRSLLHRIAERMPQSLQ